MDQKRISSSMCISHANQLVPIHYLFVRMIARSRCWGFDPWSWSMVRSSKCLRIMSAGLPCACATVRVPPWPSRCRCADIQHRSSQFWRTYLLVGYTRLNICRFVSWNDRRLQVNLYCNRSLRSRAKTRVKALLYSPIFPQYSMGLVWFVHAWFTRSLPQNRGFSCQTNQVGMDGDSYGYHHLYLLFFIIDIPFIFIYW